MDTLGISVVVVLQNCADLVPTALGHLEQQTLPAVRYEIIAVDNGSTDNTIPVLERYSAGAPVRIHVLDAGRKSIAKARNLGLERAHGRWVVFIDQGVLASPNLLERYAREFESGPAQAWLLGPVVPHPQLPANRLTRQSFQAGLNSIADEARLRPVEWHGYNFAAARSLLRDQGGFDETLGDHFLEVALAHKLANAGVIGRLAPKAYVYEWRPANFDEERIRFYTRGYDLFRLEAALGNSLEDLRPDTQGVKWNVHRAMMPFYVRACRNADADLRYAGPMFRRVLLNEMHRGYQDARKGRPARST